VNTVATSLDAFYLEHRQCGDLADGVEDDRVSRRSADSARYAY